MQDFCRKTLKRTQCEPVVVGEEKLRVCQPFSVCLPFGRSLYYDGHCLGVEGEPTVPDGEYGVIVVENGCIVGAKPNPVFEYTPPPCTPAAEACTSGSGDITLQPDACNLTGLDASGRVGTYLVTEAGNNILIEGCGTANSPLRISAVVDVDTSTYVQGASNQRVVVSGTGTASDPYVLDLAEVMTSGTYGSFTVDRYGRITNFDDSGETQVTAVVEGNGIHIDTVSGIATVSLAEVGVDTGDYLFGGYLATIDLAGRITELRQSIALEEGQYDPHDYMITVNALGSITVMTPFNRPAVNRAVVHSPSGGTTTCSVTTDCVGNLYAVWQGFLPITTSGTSTVTTGVYTTDVASYMNVTYISTSTGDTDTGLRFTDIIGKFGTRTTTTGSQTGVVEWRGRSVNVCNPDTYTVTVADSGTGYCVLDVGVV